MQVRGPQSSVAKMTVCNKLREEKETQHLAMC